MSDTLRVWVYGTLKVGGKFSPRFDEKRLSSQPAIAMGTMYNITGWYPGVKFDGKNELQGEIHEYKDKEEVEHAFDSIEGCMGDNPNNLYNKVKITALVNGEPVECISYEFNRSLDNAQVVESGFWEL